MAFLVRWRDKVRHAFRCHVFQLVCFKLYFEEILERLTGDIGNTSIDQTNLNSKNCNAVETVKLLLLENSVISPVFLYILYC